MNYIPAKTAHFTLLRIALRSKTIIYEPYMQQQINKVKECKLTVSKIIYIL